MYYSYPCSYCSKIFYTFNDSREDAAKKLFFGIKEHLVSYGEDSKEHRFDDYPEIDINMIYASLSESIVRPVGAYEL